MRKYLGAGIPGIPPAPTTRWSLREVDIYFQNKYAKLYERLPILSQEDILKARYPYHALLFRTLTKEGYSQVVDEINAIAQLEKLQEKGRNLLLEKDKLTLIANTLKECEQLIAMNKRELGLELRKNLIEKLIVEHADIWLAIKFIENCLQTCKSVNDPPTLYQRVEAESHCLLACVAHGYPEYFDDPTDVVLNNLDRCREISNFHRAWQFKRDVATFKIPKPATLQGLRKDYETIATSSTSLYIFATMLLEEVYFNIAENIFAKSRDNQVKTKVPQDWAEKALELAFEVRHPVTLHTSILRFGKLLMHVGEIKLALPYFQELQDISSVNQDTLTQAVAINNIGLCYDRQLDCIRALDQFNNQLEISEKANLPDSAGEAYFELGKILLNEGQLWEAEECYQKSHQYLNTAEELDHESNLVDTTWAMIGISAGQNLWSRFAGLCQSKDPSDLERIIQWKSRRLPLPLVSRPDYELDLISEFYNPDHFQSTSGDKTEGKKVTFKPLPGDSKKQLLSSYREMLYQDDSFEFASDARGDNLFDYHNFSIYRAEHWARSLTEALSKRSSSFNLGVTRDVAVSGRNTYADKQKPKDVNFFDY